ncbi:LuxR C-terminal-related transcriptional regulator [Rahnella sp. PD12R]|uniref:LuxR C-terminal-related transcriptional regulator n=1 Tax=Rahnella sp. PD12R TaxID=2855688 RepID=UPI001C44439E|nr:LuxR C-terminal-related transcriptional regulator [Rahnella sp. PD12R]MBV6817988.1 LuxR C-terminal-related transcriptional regulator [Rahnella sp. PD12R]
MISINRIGILNDSPLMRLGLKRFLYSLNPRMAGVRSFVSAGPLLLSKNQDIPELLICDFPVSHGEMHQRAEELLALCHLYPRLRLIVYSYNRTAESLQQLGRSPRISLISRYETLPAMKDCFVQALNGNQIISPIIRAEIDAFRHVSKTVTKALTGSEIEVLNNLFSGVSIAEMSYRLNGNIKTLSGYKRSAMRKLGVGNNAQLFSLRDVIRTILASHTVSSLQRVSDKRVTTAMIQKV